MRKSHDPVSGIEQTLVDAHKSLSVARDQERVYIRQLMPRTVYSFNISAKFIDGSWGPVVQLHAETTSDGQSALHCCCLVQLFMLFITYQCIDVPLASIGVHCVLAHCILARDIDVPLASIGVHCILARDIDVLLASIGTVSLLAISTYHSPLLASTVSLLTISTYHSPLLAFTVSLLAISRARIQCQ